jgi:hypothetical protein
VLPERQLTCEIAVAADLSSAVLLLSLDTARRWNPNTEWKWKQVEDPGPRIDLI